MKKSLTLLLLCLGLAFCKEKRPRYEPSPKPNDNPNHLDSDVMEFPSGPIEPTVIHRLNRFEYNNTIRDLLALDLKPANAFPSDPITQGFDNIAGNLSFSPVLADLYNQTARELAMDRLRQMPRTQIRIEPQEVAKGKGGVPFNDGFSIDKTLTMPFTLQFEESLTISVNAGSARTKPTTEPLPIMTVTLDGKKLMTYTVAAAALAPIHYTAKVKVPKGAHALVVTFDNPVVKNAVNATGTHLILNEVKLTSDVRVSTPDFKKLSECAKAPASAETCRQAIYLQLAERAWRRPLRTQEKDDLLALWKTILDAKGTSEDALRTAYQAIILSSKFVFRTIEPEVPQPKPIDRVDGYTLASRLSYFLWSSMPDADLLEVAASGVIKTEAGLRAQVKRMLADPKAQGLVTGFASQWLGTRDLPPLEKDKAIYKTFDSELKKAMALEVELFFADFLKNGRPIADMLAPGFVYVNDRLASHYKLPAPGSKKPVKVNVEANARGGILSQGAWLSLTSLPSDTSPVKRGNWVFEHLLCSELPAPPAVPPLPPMEPGKAIQTIRQQFETHIADPACKSCHKIIDPIGFGLEGFDATGAARTLDAAGQPVDSKGKLPDGRTFDDASGLADLLRETRDFSNCVTQKLYGYAMGRTIAESDLIYLNFINSKLTGANDRLDELILMIVLSPPFRMANFSEDL